jgi:hypothetical protein
MRDVAWNYSHLNHAELGNAGFPRDIWVRGTTDRARPKMTGFRRTPAQLDARTTHGRIRVTVKAADADSGVSSVRVSRTDPQEYGTAVGAGSQLHRVSGTRRNGILRRSDHAQGCSVAASSCSRSVVRSVWRSRSS